MTVADWRFVLSIISAAVIGYVMWATSHPALDEALNDWLKRKKR